MISTRTAAKVAIPVATIGLAAALVGPSIASASSSSASSSTSSATNGGSISVTLTAPRAATRSHAANVTCDSSGSTYTASVKRAVRGVPVKVTLSVPSYNGAGSYTGETITVKAPRRTVIRTPKAGVTITSTGGSYSFDRTRHLRHRSLHVAGTATWTCSTPSGT